MYTTLQNLLYQSQELLDKLSHIVKVDLMPGEIEMSNQFLP